MDNIIEINNLSFAYQKENVLENVNLKIKEKDFVVFMGPNGAGKSTLVKLIAGFLKVQTGNIKIFGKPIKKEREKIGLMPQNFDFLNSLPLSIEDLVLSGLTKKNSYFPWFNQEEKKMCEIILKKFDLYQLKNKSFSEISGGQKQKTLLARTLISNPEIIILDEPNNHLDIKTEQDLYLKLKELNQEKTIILVTHDISAVSKYVKTVVCINKNIKVNPIKNIVPQDFVPIIHNCNL
jgi:zinc transport system ATP-binding protein